MFRVNRNEWLILKTYYYFDHLEFKILTFFLVNLSPFVIYNNNFFSFLFMERSL